MYYFLLSSLLVSNVLLRVFTNHYRILPKILNAIDVGIVLLIFICYVFNREKEWEIEEYNWVLPVLVSFNCILIVASILNYNYIYLRPALSQFVMYNEPIILFLAIINLPLSLLEIQNFIKLFILLLVLQIIIGCMQLPMYFSTGNSEAIIGTFHGNAEHYATFILLAVFFIIGKSKVVDRLNGMYYVFSFLILGIILLIDNKASWFGLGISIIFIYMLFVASGEIVTEKIKYIVILIMIAAIGSFVVMNRSGTLKKFKNIYDSYNTGNFLQLGKLKAYGDIVESFRKNIHMVVIGSGPATFYSRSSRQYYFLTEDMYYARSLDRKIFEEYQVKQSNAMAGVITRSFKEPYFKKFYRDSKIHMVGTGQVDEPYSSYAALLGETGILGTALYIGIYLIVLKNMLGYFQKHRTDEFVFPLVIITVGFIVYSLSVSIYTNWMETGRMMTILWSLAGIVVKYSSIKEYDGLKNIYSKPAWYEVPQNTYTPT